MQRNDKDQPAPAHPQLVDPLLDGAQPTDAGKLQQILPEISDLAQKVGGMDRLSEIVDSVKSLKE